MNLKMIEAQFEKIDQRSKRISEYFNPVFRGRKQHPYIKEIKEDFTEDSKLYSLDKYMYTSKKTSSISLPPIVKTEDHPVNPPNKQKIFTVPRRKQLKIDSMKELKPEVQYKGSFSITKLLPDRKSPKVSLSMQLPRHVESWADGVDNEYYPESVNFSMYSLDSELKEVKSYPENISSEYIKESFSQLTKFSSKNSRYELSPKDLLGLPRRNLNFPDVVVKYQTDPNLKIQSEKGECKVQICDIGTMAIRVYLKVPVEDGLLLVRGCKKLNMESEFGAIWGHTFELSISKGGKCEKYFVSFNKFSKEVEESVMRNISIYKDIQNSRNAQKLKLPKISELAAEQKKQIGNEFNNPITEALMKFRNKARAFNPESYLAKLSLFETHAYIREKYSKNINSC